MIKKFIISLLNLISIMYLHLWSLIILVCEVTVSFYIYYLHFYRFYFKMLNFDLKIWNYFIFKKNKKLIF